MELRIQILKLVKEEKHTEALAHFKARKNNYTVDEISSEIFLTSAMLKCLRLTEQFEAAGKYLQIYKIEINENTPQPILVNYILLLYDQYKLHTQNSEVRGQIVRKIIPLLNPILNSESEFNISFYNTLILRILKTETRTQIVDHKLICELCYAVKSNALSNEYRRTTIIHKGKEKNKELASVLEEWYVQYSKALFALGRFEESIKISKEALREIKKMHYDNDIWFGRRIARSFVKLGSYEPAIHEYEKLIRKKDDWFILAELGNLYKKTGDDRRALQLLQTAVLKPGDIKFKIGIIEDIGELLRKSDNQSAKNHYILSVIIRKKHGWKISQELLLKANIDNAEENVNIDFGKLLKKLQQYWQNAVKADSKAKEKRLKGIVFRMASPKENGTDIRIKSENGTHYYAFVRKDNRIYNKLKTGTAVSFFVVPIKDKELDRAVKIKISEGSSFI